MPDTYKITSLYPAAFLIAKGIPLKGIEKEIRRVTFVFDNPEICKQLVDSWNYAPENSEERLVDAPLYVSAVKKLKETIYQ